MIIHLTHFGARPLTNHIPSCMIKLLDFFFIHEFTAAKKPGGGVEWEGGRGFVITSAQTPLKYIIYYYYIAFGRETGESM